LLDTVAISISNSAPNVFSLFILSLSYL